MTDPRLQKLAQVLINYCLELKAGQQVRIEAAALAEPLIREAYREALKVGAHPSVRAGIGGLTPIFFELANEAQLKFASEIELFAIEKLDARLVIWADWNTRELTNADPKKMAMAQGARKELFKRFMDRTAKGEMHWVGTLFPNHASAQDAEMSLEEYENFVFGAMLVDRPDPVAEWRRISKEQERQAQVLNQVKTIRMQTRDTDLTFQCAGRKWINCDGQQNFPDGEIFVCPIEDSVEGTIRFSFPGIYMGKEVDDIRLRFVKGKVVEAHAAKAEDFLLSVLDTDPGARFVGEISFGTNYGIQRFTKNTLFDEKIGGTMHLALGASLKESGGVNESAVHWDIICDFRQAGEVHADGKLVLKDGKLLI